MNTDFNVLKAIQQIAKKSEDSKLDEENMKLANSEISEMSEYLRVSRVQAIFFSVIFAMNYTEPSVTIEDMADHFDLNALDILSYHTEIKELISRGIIGDKKNSRRNLYLADKHFNIPNQIIDAVLNNQVIETEAGFKKKDLLSFLHELDRLFAMREEEIISTPDLFSETKDLKANYNHLNELKTIEKLKLDIKEELFLYHLCMRMVTGSRDVILENVTEEIFDNIRERFLFNKKLLRQKGMLFHHGLIEFTKSYFKNKQRLKLTDKSLNMMFGDDEDLFIKQEHVDNLVKPGAIKKKELFYNEKEQQRVHFLRDMLQKDKLSELRNRLREKNMPAGVTVLLHGSPGTGKTETVKQLAREAEREIIHVDMSQTKSMWFGESEKKVKEIFDEYERYSKKKEKLPILLFNEADAIFSTRMQVSHSTVSQTQNAIQNILLEQLENFDGILVATTNLTINLDKAFDRRFLYKIKFHAPSAGVKSQIWKSKLEDLPESDCLVLAEKYHFSGGQIDNIARKVLTEEVLYGEKPDLNKIMSYCEDEFIQNERKSLGFLNRA